MAKRKVKVIGLFVQTRKMIRAAMRKEYGRKAFSNGKQYTSPWSKYQAENRGKRKLTTEWRKATIMVNAK